MALEKKWLEKVILECLKIDASADHNTGEDVGERPLAIETPQCSVSRNFINEEDKVGSIKLTKVAEAAASSTSSQGPQVTSDPNRDN